MANQRRVQTTYDSGDNLTAQPVAGGDYKQNADPVPASPPQNQDMALLKVVMDDFKIARDYVRDNYEANWNDYWKCYNLIRTRRGYEGIADGFVPEAFTILESVKANIAGGKPRFQFVAMNDQQVQDTDIINHLLDYYWEENGMTIKALNWVHDMLLYGNGILFMSWEDDMPCVQNIPLQDFFVDPTATHLNRPDEPGYARYAGYRYLTDRDSLRKKTILDPKTGEYIPYYKNIDAIPDFDGKWDKMDKDAKEGFLGSTLGKGAVKKQVECIVYYTKKKKVVIANRKTIIYEGENPYYRTAKEYDVPVLDVKTGQPPVDPQSGQPIIDPSTGQPPTKHLTIKEIKPFLPFAVLRNYVDTSLFYAKGDMAILIDQQEMLNDLSNQKEDNITFVLNNMWQIDPQFAHLKDQIESIPGAVYPIPEGALKPIEKTVVGQEGDAEIMRIKDDMRRATAAEEIMQGAQPNSRTTATEITATVNQATQRFSTKLNTLENEGYAQLARILFKMVQIFVDEPMAVRVVGPQGTQWTRFDPQQFGGEYEPRVMLDSSYKVAKAEEGQKYLQVHQLYGGSLLINQQEFARDYLEKVLNLPEERVNKLLDVDPNAQLPLPQPNIRVNLAAPMQPDQEAQLLSRLGIQSSKADLMLGAGIDPATAAHHLAAPNNTNPGTAVHENPDIPPGMIPPHEAGLAPSPSNK